MAKTSNHYILILCGGTGPRLWPLSHANHPKQFLKLFGNRSLIQDTIQRFRKFVNPKNILLISNRKYLRELKKQVGDSIPSQNIIAEPEKKNTTMAVVYGAAIIRQRNSDAIITAAPSDHFIDKFTNFKRDILQTVDIAASTNNIVTLGIKPTYPNPAFGYILPGTKTKNSFPVIKFIEKPSVIDAQILIKKDAAWNSGIYTFSLNTLGNQLAHHQKDFFQLYEKLSEILKKPKSISRIFKLAENIPFDKAISEKSKDLCMINTTFEWSDVGEWQSIFDHLTKDKNNIALINKNSLYISLNSKNCLISGMNQKLIGLVGLNNLAIIDTADSLLVCNLHDSFSVRDLIRLIVANPKLKKYFLTSK